MDRAGERGRQGSHRLVVGASGRPAENGVDQSCQAQQERESPEFISQAREILRELIVAIGVKLESAPRSRADCLTPLVDVLLNLRQEFRTKKQFDTADAIRQSLEAAGIIIEDGERGSRWRLNPS